VKLAVVILLCCHTAGALLAEGTNVMPPTSAFIYTNLALSNLKLPPPKLPTDLLGRVGHATASTNAIVQEEDLAAADLQHQLDQKRAQDLLAGASPASVWVVQVGNEGLLVNFARWPDDFDSHGDVYLDPVTSSPRLHGPVMLEGVPDFHNCRTNASFNCLINRVGLHSHVDQRGTETVLQYKYLGTWEKRGDETSGFQIIPHPILPP
jgi:hypothetical protein